MVLITLEEEVAWLAFSHQAISRNKHIPYLSLPEPMEIQQSLKIEWCGPTLLRRKFTCCHFSTLK